jgi:hypothetical protein
LLTLDVLSCSTATRVPRKTGGGRAFALVLLDARTITVDSVTVNVQAGSRGGVQGRARCSQTAHAITD